MGGASSRVARKLPSKVNPTKAGFGPQGSAGPKPIVRASEVKSHDIEMDARDPDFMQKLNRLGPVRVDHNMTTVRAGEHMQRLLSSQNISEQQASAHSMTKNRLTSGMLSSLLNERKSLASRSELPELAQKYDIDLEVLERVATFANTPSVLKGSERKIVENDGQERVTCVATWEDAQFIKVEK